MLKEHDLLAIEDERANVAPRRRSAAAAAWDRAHLRTITTKLSVDQAKRLQVLCLLEGETPYRLVRRYLLNWIQTVERRQIPEDLVTARAVCESLDWDCHRLKSSRIWNGSKRGR